MAVDDFFGRTAAGVVAVAVGSGLDHASALLLGLDAHALGAVDVPFAEQVQGVVIEPLLWLATAQVGGDQLLVGVVAEVGLFDRFAIGAVVGLTADIGEHAQPETKVSSSKPLHTGPWVQGPDMDHH